MIEDVIAESRRRIVSLDPASAADVRNARAPVIGFSAGLAAADRAIKDFLFPRLSRPPRILRILGEAAARARGAFRRHLQTATGRRWHWLPGGLAPRCTTE